MDLAGRPRARHLDTEGRLNLSHRIVKVKRHRCAEGFAVGRIDLVDFRGNVAADRIASPAALAASLPDAANGWVDQADAKALAVRWRLLRVRRLCTAPGRVNIDREPPGLKCFECFETPHVLKSHGRMLRRTRCWPSWPIQRAAAVTSSYCHRTRD